MGYYIPREIVKKVREGKLEPDYLFDKYKKKKKKKKKK